MIDRRSLQSTHEPFARISFDPVSSYEPRGSVSITPRVVRVGALLI